MKIKSNLLKLRELFYSYSHNQQYKSSFLLPFILNTLGTEMPEDAAVMVNYSFKMFVGEKSLILAHFNIKNIKD